MSRVGRFRQFVKTLRGRCDYTDDELANALLIAETGKPRKRMKSWSESDHPRANNGQFGPGNDLPTSDGQTIGDIASQAKSLPRTIYAKATSKVKSVYGKLEARYGKKTAIAIMGAGLLGAPLPIPGSSLLTAAPILVAAEMYLKFHSKEAAALSQDEIEELGKVFVRDLMAGWTVRTKPMNRLPSLSPR